MVSPDSAAKNDDSAPLLEDDSEASTPTEAEEHTDGYDDGEPTALVRPDDLDLDDDELTSSEDQIAPSLPDEPAPYPMPEPQAQPVVPAAAPLPATRTPVPTWRDRRAANRLRARKVRRLVRHIEPWSMLKISLLFYFCLWIILLVAGVLLWGAVVSSGTVDNIENFIKSLFVLESFEFNAEQIFRACALGGLVLVVAATGFNVLLAVLFNLISDLTGGMRITVVEEESARMFARPVRGTASLPVDQEPVAGEISSASANDTLPG